jgi:hypothetical protein
VLSILWIHLVNESGRPDRLAEELPVENDLRAEVHQSWKLPPADEVAEEEERGAVGVVQTLDFEERFRSGEGVNDDDVRTGQTGIGKIPWNSMFSRYQSGHEHEGTYHIVDPIP